MCKICNCHTLLAKFKKEIREVNYKRKEKLEKWLTRLINKITPRIGINLLKILRHYLVIRAG